MRIVIYRTNVNLQFAAIENACVTDWGHEGDPFFCAWRRCLLRGLTAKLLKGWCGASHPPSTSSYFQFPTFSNIFQHVPTPQHWNTLCDLFFSASDLWNATRNPEPGYSFKWWPPMVDRTHSSKSPKSCAASHNTFAATKKEHGHEILSPLSS